MYDSTKNLTDITKEQNNSVFEKINPKFREAARRLISMYDWDNSSLPKDEETLINYDKLIEFNKNYVEKREIFLKMISSYLK
jgi:hypothetical protein